MKTYEEFKKRKEELRKEIEKDAKMQHDYFNKLLCRMV